MRTIHQAFLAGGMAVLLGAGLAGTAVATAQTPTATASSATAIADDTRTADLSFSRDEERMARDLYTLFGQTYDAAIFDRIAASEQQHFDAVGTLLTGYAITDPAVGQPAGTYANADVQKLYDQWKAQGLTSVQDAYAVGVALEQTDIADLQGILARNADADAQRVFTRLLAASQHHLDAFTNAVNGGTDAAFCTGSGTGAQLGARGDGHGMGMGEGTGMGTRYRMGHSDS
jgi:hypothetical protein